jgi:hypothetical protein
MTVPHQHQRVKALKNKRELSLQDESLFSAAMYDMDSIDQQHHQQLEQQQDLEPLPASTQFTFYLVDGYTDFPSGKS